MLMMFLFFKKAKLQTKNSLLIFANLAIGSIHFIENISKDYSLVHFVKAISLQNLPPSRIASQAYVIPVKWHADAKQK